MCVEASFKEFDRVYKMLDIGFESIAGESFLSGTRCLRFLAQLREQGLLTQREGASIVGFGSVGQCPPFIALRSDDATLYGTRDLARADVSVENLSL